MRRRIEDSVVVITGASSGIGRATALEFAQRGATVLVAARSEQPLQEVAGQCQRLGGRALAVPTDVADPQAVQRLAQTAVERFGRIDVWVNNAAVTLFGRIEEAPLEAIRRVIETNLLGYLYGARAAIPYFREQGHGVLINLSSVAGTFGQPYTSAYVATKFAIRGLSQSLRQELRGTDIHVCTVLPASIDTPLFQHGGNYIGRAARPMPPIYLAQQVAETIVQLVQRPQREVFVGNAGRILSVLHALMPGLTERLIARQVEKTHFADLPAGPNPGNLFEPVPAQDCVSGGWKSAVGTATRRYAAIGLAASIPLIAAGWIWYRNGRQSHPKSFFPRRA